MEKEEKTVQMMIAAALLTVAETIADANDKKRSTVDVFGKFRAAFRNLKAFIEDPQSHVR